jgi:hypothetical protein
MPKYRIWDPDLTNEAQLIVWGGKWASYEAENTDSAANDLAQEMADSGNYPDHFSEDAQEFDLHVRDLDTLKLYAVTIHWDWEPAPFVAKARELTEAEDDSTSDVGVGYSVDASSITLVQTCSACPEQYDAFFEGKQVGYLRLRHGEFRVDAPDCDGETIYWSDEPEGDGDFASWEREGYLEEAKEAIAKWLTKNPGYLKAPSP